ncbi:peptidoglycan-binding protein [Sphaerisporangium siamense]|uniref:Lipoprotein-anchoring transpeptidase ErfK/SrfK n=1 Tax=Sphaerisporangium siamense TaxID=795645 RepID=A0A7W7GCR2_9ACTN|nr:L,D-transpeptidase family protein [Sphaerisporangium siamense]MBB4704857.1 lipoprotein-anchoring transpeptidase ErfK/SrfK [Sphaerisporangium siamense]GII83659.1 peptidoglycan-binding protein [Sphaerisporangium siamense]
MGVGRRLAAAAVLTAGAVLVSGLGTGIHYAAPAGGAGARGATVEIHATPVGREVAVAPFTAPNVRLKIGAKGAAVKQLQSRLRELGYAPGKIDARYGGTTQSAVWAFQKVQGITPTSTITSRTWRALEDPRPPRVLVPRGKPDRVEVDLTRQIAVLYRSGQVRLITHVSSGSGIPYCETATWQGKVQKFCGDARTPTGDYKTTWRRSGWHKSYLGQLYNPIFFNGGIALHGALSVPLYPASHGCVRLPMHVAQALPSMLGTGVPVHVRGKFRR